jgi:hypothetical protein
VRRQRALIASLLLATVGCAGVGENEAPLPVATRDAGVVDQTPDPQPEPDGDGLDVGLFDAGSTDGALGDAGPLVDAALTVDVDAATSVADAAPPDVDRGAPVVDMGAAGCVEDVQCPGAQICEGGLCLDPQPCVDDSVCAADERCEAGECLPGARPDCFEDADCLNDGRCINGACALGECMENTDCVVNERCEDARCVPDLIGCLEHADCDMGEVCADGVCDPNPPAECLNADDCPMGQLCNDGVCEADGVGGCATPSNIGAFGRVDGETTGESAVHGATCGGGATGPEQVYSVGLPMNGPICVRTLAANFDAVLHVRRGPCADPEGEVLCDDAAPDALGRSQIDVELQGDAPVWLFVDGFGAEAGTFSLEVLAGECAALPECVDDAECVGDAVCEMGACVPVPGTCDRPLPLALGAVDGVTAGVGVQAGICGGGAAPEQVFEFVPAAAGLLCFETTGSGFDTVLHARSGGCEGAELACSDDGENAGGLQSDVTIEGVVGQAITVIVDGYDNRSGAFTLTASSGACGGDPVGPCEGIAVAQLGEQMGTTIGAGADSEGSCGQTAESPDVALRFRALQAGPICARTAGSAFDTVLYVRTACDDPDSEVGCNDDVEAGVDPTSKLTVQAAAGVDYFVFVDGYDSLASGPGQGAFVLELSAGVCP